MYAVAHSSASMNKFLAANDACLRPLTMSLCSAKRAGSGTFRRLASMQTSYLKSEYFRYDENPKSHRGKRPETRTDIGFPASLQRARPAANHTPSFPSTVKSADADLRIRPHIGPLRKMQRPVRGDAAPGRRQAHQLPDLQRAVRAPHQRSRLGRHLVAVGQQDQELGPHAVQENRQRRL